LRFLTVLIIDTARIVYLSVCLSVSSIARRTPLCGGFAAVGPALIDRCTVGAAAARKMR